VAGHKHPTTFQLLSILTNTAAVQIVLVNSRYCLPDKAKAMYASPIEALGGNAGFE